MEPIIQISTGDTRELLPWHRPIVQRLDVSLDTRDSPGSGTDGFTETGRTPN
jgi:hypothetical protein